MHARAYVMWVTGAMPSAVQRPLKLGTKYNGRKDANGRRNAFGRSEAIETLGRALRFTL